MKSGMGLICMRSQVTAFVKEWSQAALQSTSCPVTYSYEADGVTHLAEGVTRDVSETECEMQGSVLPPVNSQTTVTLSLRDRRRPVSFQGRITGASEGSFTVALSEVNASDYTRILQSLHHLGYVNMIVW